MIIKDPVEGESTLFCYQTKSFFLNKRFWKAIKSDLKGKILEKLDIIKGCWSCYEIVFYALVTFGHYFVQYGFILIYLFYLFSWETSLVTFLCFLSFLSVLCFKFNATICIMIIYISATCSMVFCHFTVCKNIKIS